MDIDILLALQDFRNGAGEFLSGFLSKMTWLGELNTAIVFMAVIYWCVSRDFGSYLLMGWSGNRLVNGLRLPAVDQGRAYHTLRRFHHHGDGLFISQRPYDECVDRIRRRGGSQGRSPGAARRAGSSRPARGVQPDLSGRAYAAGRSGRRRGRNPGHVSDREADAVGQGSS